MRSLHKILFGIFFASSLLVYPQGDRKSTDFTPEKGFTAGIEGPAVNADGFLFAVNFQEEGTIGRVSQDGQAEVYLSLPKGSVGNGIRFDLDGNMFVADYVAHRLYRFERGSKEAVVWAEDSQMNQPNDLTIAPDGTIYLSDPNWSEGTGNLWCVSPERKVILLEKGMGTTNGVEVSPDGKTLYVNESLQKVVWKYDIKPDGSLANKRQFLSFSDFGLDGMRCDLKGNLYITRYGKGTVIIADPEGKILKEIKLKGLKPTNIAFGGKDGKTCYVTMQARGCIEQFPALFPGNYYSKIH